MKNKPAYWQRYIYRQAKSGKCIKAFCAASSISVATLHYWTRKLRPVSDPVRFEEVLRPVEVE